MWSGTAQPNAPMSLRNQRWFVVWLGTGKDPIDPAAAKALAAVHPAVQPAASAGAGPQRPGTRGPGTSARQPRRCADPGRDARFPEMMPPG